ncbi:uncharacterized protein FIBRA_00166 [Fibroporia radiculosa]|uniref:LysM domain-containing protein n=1 Tax=Fibroporia radiculosa TaxID=599839 RepID=J7RGI5_9APHY|nr:uncharacterized protein FIBRA_00166 [Fibroporia radiculosa]CCL98172.1 predicted protein [Fibroporia radiculosa]
MSLDMQDGHDPASICQQSPSLLSARPDSDKPLLTMDRTTSLCLACSSSLPPCRTGLAAAKDPDNEIHITPCCSRPVCPACIRSNPRLLRYNPCLHCLGGVGAVGARSVSSSKTRSITEGHSPQRPVNVDGAVRDGDVLVLDDDSEEGGELDEEDHSTDPDSPFPATPPPPYLGTLRATPNPPHDVLHNLEGEGNLSRSASIKKMEVAPTSSGPQKYYIKPSDTLLGIALKFSVDGRLLCQLNHLPPSTLRTTPHILHTRTFLMLPPSARGADLASSSTPSAQEDAEHRVRRTRERAEVRLQTLTKEVDWKVAKAYVAVADIIDDDPDTSGKTTTHEGALEKLKIRQASSSADATNGEGNLEQRAIDQYLDDEEWEARERKEGRGVTIPAFPYLQDRLRDHTAGLETSWKSFWSHAWTALYSPNQPLYISVTV